MKDRPIAADVLAGLTGAVAGAPQAMGFALLAGVSPIYGLYAAFLPTIVGALTTGSWLMTVAPTNALMLLVASAMSQINAPNPIIALSTFTLLVGAIQVGFGVLRLGSLTRFVSNAVTTGFIAGAGILIVLGQIDHVVGVESASGLTGIDTLINWVRALSHIDGQTLIIGVFSVIMISRLHHTRFKSIATLVTIVITSIWVWLLGWDSVPLVRDIAPITGGLPDFTPPLFQYVPALFGTAMATAVLASVQSAALVDSLRDRDPTPTRHNQDLVGQGLSNIVGGFFQSLPAAGSLSRTAVNRSAGAKTRLANLLAGVFIGLLMLFAATLIERITLAALAAHLIVAAFSLFSWPAIRLVWRTNWTARASLLVTWIAAIVLPIEQSIYLGVFVSLALYAYTSSNESRVIRLIPTEDNRYRADVVPSTLTDSEPVILSLTGSLYFAALRGIEEQLPEPGHVEHPVVILRVRNQAHLGSTGIRVIRRYARLLKDRGGVLMLSGVSESMRAELQRTNTIDDLGAENVFFSTGVYFESLDQALAAAQTLKESPPAGRD
jgi:SulP family sulfate permease